MKVIIIGMLFFLTCILTLYIILKPYFIDKKTRNNIINFDSFMNNYIFVVNENIQNIIERLSIHNVYDKLEYTFDTEDLTICFKHLTVKLQYQLQFISTTNSCTYLLVSKVYLVHGKSNIPFMINDFFINKLNAQPLDYITFERTVYNKKS